MDHLIHFVATAATAAVVGMLVRSSSRSLPEVAGEGRLVLRHGMFGWTTFGLLLGGAVFFAAFPAFVDRLPVAVGFTFAAVFLALSVPVALELRTTVTIDATGVTTKSVWTGERSVRWDELKEVTFAVRLGWFMLRARGVKLRVFAALKGIDQFVEVLKAKQPMLAAHAIGEFHRARVRHGVPAPPRKRRTGRADRPHEPPP